MGLVAAVTLAGERTKVFNIGSRRLFGIAVLLAVLMAIDGVIGTIRRWRAPGRDAAEARVQKALLALLVGITEDDGSVKLQDVGASAFVPRWRLLRRKKLWWWPGKVLVRVLRFRLDNHPQASPVRWQKGKGAVGSCWDRARSVHRDWHVQQSRYSASDLSQAEFAAMSRDERDGFEFREFVAIAAKYSEVLAVPVMSVGGDVVGVISLDVSARAGLAHCILRDVEDQADAAAVLVRDDLSQLYAQN